MTSGSGKPITHKNAQKSRLFMISLLEFG